MASKVGVVLETCLEHSLLVLAHPVDPVHLPLVALPDVLQQLPLLLEALLWGLHGDEGGRADVSCCNHCVVQSVEKTRVQCGETVP